MKCVICGGDIKAKKTPDGKVRFSNGNNAEPVKAGRCCDACNEARVIPARLRLLKK